MMDPSIVDWNNVDLVKQFVIKILFDFGVDYLMI
jgi:hypothetical protein